MVPIRALDNSRSYIWIVDMACLKTQLNLSTRAYDRTRNVNLARMIADLRECEEIQSIHLAAELHAPQSTEIDPQHCVLSQVLIHLIRKQYKGNLQSLN
jgi:hypothetical protein